MAIAPTDIEVGTSGYDAVASPKLQTSYTTQAICQLDDDALPRRPDASIPKLMLLSLPSMAIPIAWSTQTVTSITVTLPDYALVQILMPIATILTVLTAGVFSDTSRATWGRRRPFLAAASTLCIVCLTLMGFTKDIGEALGNSNNSSFFNGGRNNWTEFFCVFFWIWLAITLAIMQITTSLLVADFAGERQVLGASISQGWSILGSLYVSRYISIVGYPLSSTHGYMAMASIAVLIAVVVACVAANESPKVGLENVRTLSSKLKSIVSGIVTFPSPLCVYGLVIFVFDYGNLVYNWSLFPFFQMELFGAGDCNGVDCDLSQDNFMKASDALNDCSHWAFQVVAYLLTWAFPFAVERFGAKGVVAAAIVPQALLVIVAFVTKPVIVTQIVVVLITLSRTLVFVLVVPLIVHLMGSSKPDIGVYLGVMYTANSLASLLHYIVEKSVGYDSSSLEYKLPIFIGGLTAVVGLAIWAFFFKVKMHAK